MRKLERKLPTNGGLEVRPGLLIAFSSGEYLLARAFLVGDDKETAAELAQMKVQMVAIEQASTQKNCGIQVQRPPES